MRAASLCAASSTAARVSSFGVMGRMTTCVGATRGGSTRPSSSACAMMSVPISRVLMPQLVVHANSSLPARDWNLMPAGVREILPEEMRRARLDRLAVLHHRLDAMRLHRAGEPLALASSRPRNTGMARWSRTNVSYTPSIFSVSSQRLGLGLVRGVALLPEKFGRAQEQARAHFPAHDVGPLVDEDGQVAVGLHPLRVASRR